MCMPCLCAPRKSPQVLWVLAELERESAGQRAASVSTFTARSITRTLAQGALRSSRSNAWRSAFSAVSARWVRARSVLSNAKAVCTRAFASFNRSA